MESPKLKLLSCCKDVNCTKITNTKDETSGKNQRSKKVKKNLKFKDQHHNRDPHELTNLDKVMIIIYGLFCFLMSVVLITTEPFKACGLCGGVLKVTIEVYLIYMYYAAIIWILYMFINIHIAKSNKKVSIRCQDGFDVQLGAHMSSKENLNSNGRPPDIEEAPVEWENNSSKSSIQMPVIHVTNKYKFSYDYGSGTCGLYLRVGIGILSLCTMIDVGLNLLKLVESYSNDSPMVKSCMGAYIVSVIAEVGAFIFTFIQCFFIFEHGNVVINEGKILASIGLCHLICTNFCIALRNIVHETFSEVFLHNKQIQEHKNLQRLNDSLVNQSSSIPVSTKMGSLNKNVKAAVVCGDVEQSEPYSQRGIQGTKEKIAPYLFPCVIEYSLLCLTVFYIIWDNIDRKRALKRSPTNSNLLDHGNNIGQNSQLSASQIALNYSRNRKRSVLLNNFRIDCGKSTSGLFFGLFVLLITIISLIVFFIYKQFKGDLAAQVTELTEMILVVFSIAVILSAYFKLKDFKYSDSPPPIDRLLIMALIGVYLYSGYSLLAICASGVRNRNEILGLIIHSLTLIESTFQAGFILDNLKRCARTYRQKVAKPARSLITLLIMVNLSLWLTETFSVKKYEMNITQLNYYDIVFWSVVNSIASPLAIFFRFHASACLSEIWSILYE